MDVFCELRERFRQDQLHSNPRATLCVLNIMHFRGVIRQRLHSHTQVPSLSIAEDVRMRWINNGVNN